MKATEYVEVQQGVTTTFDFMPGVYPQSTLKRSVAITEFVRVIEPLLQKYPAVSRLEVRR